MDSDLDALLPDEPTRGGVYGLWLRVLCLSVLEIQDGRFSSKMAEDFLFDPGNIFFDFVAGELGYDPAGLRERIRKALERSRKVRRESWQDRIRAGMNHPGRRALRGSYQKTGY
jgi:hypothetical protein